MCTYRHRSPVITGTITRRAGFFSLSSFFRGPFFRRTAPWHKWQRGMRMFRPDPPRTYRASAMASSPVKCFLMVAVVRRLWRRRASGARIQSLVGQHITEAIVFLGRELLGIQHQSWSLLPYVEIQLPAVQHPHTYSHPPRPTKLLGQPHAYPQPAPAV